MAREVMDMYNAEFKKAAKMCTRHGYYENYVSRQSAYKNMAS
jgi:hypothetical protein